MGPGSVDQTGPKSIRIYRQPIHTATIHEYAPGKTCFYPPTCSYVEPNPSRNPRANSFNGCTNHPSRFFVRGSCVSVRGRFVGGSTLSTSTSSSDSSLRPRLTPIFTAAEELSGTTVVSVDWLDPSPAGVGDGDRADLTTETWECVLDVDGGGRVIGGGVILSSQLELDQPNVTCTHGIHFCLCSIHFERS